MVYSNNQLIPHDCWKVIFSNFPSYEPHSGKVNSLTDWRLVCKGFKAPIDALQKERKVVRHMRSNDNPETRLKRARSVHTLIINNWAPDFRVLHESPSRTSLRVLSACVPLTKTALRVIATLPSLTTFILHGSKTLQKSSAENISLLTNIEELEFDGAPVVRNRDQFIQSLCCLKKLKKIVMPIVRFTLDEVDRLRQNLPQLAHLDALVLEQPLEKLPPIVRRYPVLNWHEPIVVALRAIKALNDDSVKKHFLFSAIYHSIKYERIESVVDHCALHELDRDGPEISRLLTEILTPACTDPSGLAEVFRKSILSGNIDRARHLLSLGVDPNHRIFLSLDCISYRQPTALHFCIKNIVLSGDIKERKRYMDLFDLLLFYKADPNLPDNRQTLPLASALTSLKGQRLVRALLSEQGGANPNLVSPKTTIFPGMHYCTKFSLPGSYSTFSPLQLALSQWIDAPQSAEWKELVTLLLKHNANVQIVDDTGCNLFEQLCLAPNDFPFEHVLATLIAGGIDIRKNKESHVKKLMEVVINVVQNNKDGRTIIIEKLNYMAFLQERGFSLDSLSEQDKSLLLRLSEIYDVIHLAQRLKALGITVSEAEFFTAVKCANLALLNQLTIEQVERIGDEKGNSLLHIGAEAGHLDVVQMLANWGADYAQKNNEGLTPLHLAAMQSKSDVVLFLAKHEAAQIKCAASLWQ